MLNVMLCCPLPTVSREIDLTAAMQLYARNILHQSAYITI